VFSQLLAGLEQTKLTIASSVTMALIDDIRRRVREKHLKEKEVKRQQQEEQREELERQRQEQRKKNQQSSVSYVSKAVAASPLSDVTLSHSPAKKSVAMTEPEDPTVTLARRLLMEKEDRKEAARNLENTVALRSSLKKESAAITEPEDPITTTRKRSFASSVDLLEPSPAKKRVVLSASAASADDDSHTTLGGDNANESFAKKDWVKLSFSLPDPGSLGIVIKKLYLTNKYTVTQIKTVTAGSQAETAGVVAGDIVMAKREEILKWNKGPRPICFSVLRKRCTCTNQEKLAR
jgi:hypothetical protein